MRSMIFAVMAGGLVLASSSQAMTPVALSAVNGAPTKISAVRADAADYEHRELSFEDRRRLGLLGLILMQQAKGVPAIN